MQKMQKISKLKVNSEFDSNSTVENMVIIAREYGRTKKAKQLAKELNLSIGTIYQYANGLRSVGVDVAKIRRAGMYLRAVGKLKKTNPELCKSIK